MMSLTGPKMKNQAVDAGVNFSVAFPVINPARFCGLIN
jgi:hypothetical protein